MPPRLLKPNPQEEHIYSPSHMPDSPKNYSMFSAPGPEPVWMAPPSTSGWAPCLTHSPPSSPEAVQAPPKKARMRADSGLSALSSPSRLGNISATIPFIGDLVESLCLVFESGTIDLQVDPRSVDSSVVWKMLIYINQWTKNLNNVKFLNTHPVKKVSILGSYGLVSEAFSNIGIYSKALPLAPLSPKDVDSPSSPSFSSHCPCGSTSYFGCWRYCRWQCMEEEGGGTSWNIMQYDMCSCQSPLSPPPFVQHDTCPSGGKNHVDNSPASFSCGPVVQRPGSCHHSFNMSNGPSCRSIVVVVESKAASVALLPLAPQISHLIDFLPSSIMVESFHLSYGGLCLSTTSVPTPSDLSRVETFIRTLVSEGSILVLIL